jgi:hypothetical protein
LLLFYCFLYLNLHHGERKRKRKSQGNPGFNLVSYNDLFPLTTAQKQRQQQHIKNKIDKSKLEEHVNNLVAEESRKRPEVSDQKHYSLYVRRWRLTLTQHQMIEAMLKEIRDIQETLEGLCGRIVELSTKIASQAKDNKAGLAAQQKKGKKVAGRW